jgi:hypothetical protein
LGEPAISAAAAIGPPNATAANPMAAAIHIPFMALSLSKLASSQRSLTAPVSKKQARKRACFRIHTREQRLPADIVSGANAASGDDASGDANPLGWPVANRLERSQLHRDWRATSPAHDRLELPA